MQDNVSYKFCPLMAAKKQVLHSLEVMSDAICEEKALTQLSKKSMSLLKRTTCLFIVSYFLDGMIGL